MAYRSYEHFCMFTEHETCRRPERVKDNDYSKIVVMVNGRTISNLGKYASFRAFSNPGRYSINRSRFFSRGAACLRFGQKVLKLERDTLWEFVSPPQYKEVYKPMKRRNS